MLTAVSCGEGGGLTPPAAGLSYPSTRARKVKEDSTQTSFQQPLSLPSQFFLLPRPFLVFISSSHEFQN